MNKIDENYKKILIRFGELTLKKNNRHIFLNTLINNIKNIVTNEVYVEYDRIFLNYNDHNLNKLNYVFGISSFSPVIEVETDLQMIEKKLIAIVANLKDKTFKVKVKRHDKSFLQTSTFLNGHFGDLILQNSNLTVDVKNPKILFEIEIRKNSTFIFFERIQGLGGLPVGTGGKVLHLISGGIDSPIAALEMMKRGVHIDFLNFITPPHTDQTTIDKVKKIVNLLNQYQGKTTLYQLNFSDLLNLISFTSNQAYRINLMRRSFYRIVHNIALEKGYLGISNGENLGQVASQTLESMFTIGIETNLQIYRPLLTYDKLEIIEKSKKFNIFDISIEKAKESCELFAPKKPVTKPNLKIGQKLEAELSPELFQLEKEIEINKFDFRL